MLLRLSVFKKRIKSYLTRPGDSGALTSCVNSDRGKLREKSALVKIFFLLFKAAVLPGK
jgi:hypothetical protein